MRAVFLLCCSLMVLPGVGCSDSPDIGPTVPVTGTLMIDSHPFIGATVSLVNPAAGTQVFAFGTSDDQGKFEIARLDGGLGVPPGEYAVIVSKWAMPDGSPIPEGKMAADVNAREVTPLQYRDVTTTPLHVRINAEGKNDLKLELSTR